MTYTFRLSGDATRVPPYANTLEPGKPNIGNRANGPRDRLLIIP